MRKRRSTPLSFSARAIACATRGASAVRGGSIVGLLAVPVTGVAPRRLSKGPGSVARREAEVHAAAGRVRPAARDDLQARVERHALVAVDAVLGEARVLP